MSQLLKRFFNQTEGINCRWWIRGKFTGGEEKFGQLKNTTIARVKEVQGSRMQGAEEGSSGEKRIGQWALLERL